MLRWRLLLGTLIVVILVGVAWLDHLAAVHGIWLLPVAIVFAVAASKELLSLAAAGGLRPLSWPVYCGNLLLVASAWVPLFWQLAKGLPLQWEISPRELPGVLWMWPLFALAVGVLLVFIGEICRYERPGGVTANIAAAVLALVYVGVMLGLAVQLRMAWGVGALASLLIVVKTADIGAYTVGRLIGRHQMAPVLSPGKTVEGAIGALAFACFASWATFDWLVPLLEGAGAQPGTWWRAVLFGLLVGSAGMLGDLAESLMKRDVGRKDSSGWLPGLGGVLDLLDSVLVAAPVAWLCWAVGLVGG